MRGLEHSPSGVFGLGPVAPRESSILLACPAKVLFIKLAANHLLDQSANLPADHVFDRIKPIVKKVGVALDCRM
jgi:hypothetical protein